MNELHAIFASTADLTPESQSSLSSRLDLGLWNREHFLKVDLKSEMLNRLLIEGGMLNWLTDLARVRPRPRRTSKKSAIFYPLPLQDMF